MTCKQCKFWDHERGRNSAGAAVRAAPCRWQFKAPVVASSMWSERLDMERWESADRWRLMEPKDGKDCPVQEKVEWMMEKAAPTTSKKRLRG